MVASSDPGLAAKIRELSTLTYNKVKNLMECLTLPVRYDGIVGPQSSELKVRGFSVWCVVGV